MAHSLDETYFEVSTQAPSCSPRCTPHEDSEEAVRYERRRVAQELMSLDKRCDSSSALVGGAIHTRTASGIDRPLSDSLERSRRSPSINSQTSTQQDSSSSGTMGRQSGASSTTTSSWCQSIAKFWSMHISITIDDGAYRDHLALERTFLGYLRTSLVFVMIGVLIAQLFRLQRALSPHSTFGFFVVGRPLSVAFISAGLLTILIGAFRFWKLQQGLMRGKAYSGGWEVLLIMCLSVLLMLATFGLIVGINIEKTYFGL